MIIAADRLFTGETELSPGWIRIEEGHVADLGPGTPPGPADLTVAIATPGLVDTHCHGGGGGSVTDPDGLRIAARTHLAKGTTTMIASLVTAGIDDVERQTAAAAEAVADGVVAGIHLEGPWLSPNNKGAHDPALLSDPDPAVVARILAAGRGTVRQVTIAPEQPGALESIALMSGQGVVASLGHTAATYEQTLAGIEAGGRGVTHLFNAMPGLRHRGPGPILAFWRDDRVWLEIIGDGHHVDIDLVTWVVRTFPDRAVLITDAMDATGIGDGHYQLGSLEVDVRDGLAWLSGKDTIAGSTITLSDAVQRTIAAGLDPLLAVRAATVNAARYLGLTAGRLAPGAPADVVGWSQDWSVQHVIRRGEPVT